MQASSKPLDYSKIADQSKFIEGSALKCGVGLDAYGDILAYDPNVLKEAPTSVLDIFDTTKFPGKRAMRKFPAQNLEWALMATESGRSGLRGPRHPGRR